MANSAVIAMFDVIETVQVVPETVVHPVHLVKVEVEEGVAVKVTILHEGNVPALNHDEIPNVPEMVPVPVPVFALVTLYVGINVNVAVMVLFMVINT